MSFIYGDGVVEWVSSKIPENLGFDNPIGIGILSNDVLICGIVFDNWRPEAKSVCASIALTDKKILTKTILSKLFDYGFNVLGTKRILCMINKNNTKSSILCSKLGFIHEGTLRQASPKGDDILIYGMLKSECKWLSSAN